MLREYITGNMNAKINIYHEWLFMRSIKNMYCPKDNVFSEAKGTLIYYITYLTVCYMLGKDLIIVLSLISVCTKCLYYSYCPTS